MSPWMSQARRRARAAEETRREEIERANEALFRRSKEIANAAILLSSGNAKHGANFVATCPDDMPRVSVSDEGVKQLVIPLTTRAVRDVNDRVALYTEDAGHHVSDLDDKGSDVPGPLSLADVLREGVEVRLVIGNSQVAINFKPGHQSSPSIGAPCGAGCGSSNPTDGEPLPAGGTPAPSAGSTPSTARPAVAGAPSEPSP